MPEIGRSRRVKLTEAQVWNGWRVQLQKIMIAGLIPLDRLRRNPEVISSICDVSWTSAEISN
jgi:hypothetical protein